MHKGLFGWVLFIALAVMLFMLMNKQKSNHARIPLSEFNRLLKYERVARVTVGKDELYGEFKRPETINGQQIAKFRVDLPQGMSETWSFNQWLLDNAGDAMVDVDNQQSMLMQFVLPLVPWLLIFAFIWFFVFRQLRKQGGQVGQPLKVFVVNQPGQPDIESKNPSM